MKRVVLVVLIAALSIACHKHHVKPACTTAATVTDLSSLGGGCGLGFKLADGSVVVPDQHPKGCPNMANPLQNLTLTDGMKVMIGYETNHHASSACTAGTAVYVSCITLVSEKDE